LGYLTGYVVLAAFGFAGALGSIFFRVPNRPVAAGRFGGPEA